MPLPSRSLLAAVACTAACGGGGGGSNPIGNDTLPQLLACRARVDSPFQFAEIALRDDRNLGTRRVGDRAGTELHARLHPDGNTVVFARERTPNDPASREIFASTLDGSRGEVRLSQNTGRDDDPCWSPDGNTILFASDRDGALALWKMSEDGSAATRFTTPLTGGSDGDPDWSRSTDTIVWSRADSTGRHTLWRSSADGLTQVNLTDGGAAVGAGMGDHAPSFTPDGQSVVFVRRLTATNSVLARADVATGAVAVLHATPGEVGTPRVAPAADRVFFGLLEPASGRASMRLATVPIAGGAASLLWPDERWNLVGLDLLPTLPTAATPAAPVTLDVEQAQVQIATASSVFGARSQLVDEDGNEYVLTTATVDGREIAAINVRFDLPVAAATDVLDLQVRLVARATRIDGDSVLRAAIYHPHDERFDTAVELTPAATTPQALEFRTSSLRHVTQERQLRITVIADLAAGARAELRIDQVRVVLLPKAN
ncbi:MAG: PD40 domain-containing protein [Planctomycetes bacterium]|nr:PD40 domain-containing protein [Planctomycetota bacterium]